MFISLLYLDADADLAAAHAEPELIPSWLAFIRLSDPLNVPLIWQLLILEFAIDGLRLAAVNTPNMLTTPLSVIAGIVLGEYAVKSGWFNSETMLYMAFVTIANYSQASFELGYAIEIHARDPDPGSDGPAATSGAFAVGTVILVRPSPSSSTRLSPGRATSTR